MKLTILMILLSATAFAIPVTIDGKEVDVPATVRNGRTMVELKTLAEQLGWRLDYRDGKAIVSTKKRPLVEPSKVSSVEPIPEQEMMTPKDGAMTSNLRPEITARFTTILDPNGRFQFLLNGQDLTDEAVLQANEVRFRPRNRFGGGLYKVELTATTQSGETLTRSWSFQVKNHFSN